MIGLDTNILVRYLAQDDPVQSAKATKIIERRLTEENPGFVSVVAMVETVWVLDRAYGFLLITSARVAFFAGRGGTRMLEWQLEELGEIVPVGSWHGRRLRLRGPDRTVTLARFESRVALAGVARLLGAD